MHVATSTRNRLPLYTMRFWSNYPKCIICILITDFCERFNFFGLKAILVMYLSRALLFDDNSSTAIYHGFIVLCYFMPLLGAIVADGWIGKYRTIVYMCVVYCIGNIVMTATAIPYGGSYNKWSPFIAFALIAIGTGGIKPCVSAFGGDQFEEHQDHEKNTFFAVFYMSINIGSLLGMFITPLLKSKVTCFDKDCYSLSFGVPTILMAAALCNFIIGSRWYRVIPTKENTIVKMSGCIWKAFTLKLLDNGKENAVGVKPHWLDYADKYYEITFIDEVKCVLKVMYLFLPLSVFWALFDQQGSRWTLQAGQMNGDFASFQVEPDMIQVANPILILLIIPILESCVYPCLAKLHLPNSPLQRLGFGMFLAGTAFVTAAGLQLYINGKMPPKMADGIAKFRYINASPCDAVVRSVAHERLLAQSIATQKASTYVEVPFGEYTFNVSFINCSQTGITMNASKTFVFNASLAYQLVLSNTNSPFGLNVYKHDKIHQTGKGKATAWVINAIQMEVDVLLKEDKESNPRNIASLQPLQNSQHKLLRHGRYELSIAKTGYENVTKLGELASQNGAVYTVIVQYATDNTTMMFVRHEDVAPNSVNIFWQIPQYVIMSFGECFFSVTGISFAYSQAPSSMKSVLQAAWLLNFAVGNLIVVVISKFGRLPNQVYEFVLFAALMYVTVLVFAAMSSSYQYVTHTNDELSETKSELMTSTERPSDNMTEDVECTVADKSADTRL